VRESHWTSAFYFCSIQIAHGGFTAMTCVIFCSLPLRTMSYFPLSPLLRTSQPNKQNKQGLYFSSSLSKYHFSPYPVPAFSHPLSPACDVSGNAMAIAVRRSPANSTTINVFPTYYDFSLPFGSLIFSPFFPPPTAMLEWMSSCLLFLVVVQDKRYE
jgi:hypothetical protein